MTLFAPDGLQIVMMERFEGLTKEVDCHGDDGQMSLTFASQEAFDYALRTWSNINEHKDDKFLLIANHAGCGPDDERQPYIISKITEDKQLLTTFLAAQPAPWEEVASTYDIAFGKASPNVQSRLAARGWDSIKDGFEKASNSIRDIFNGSIHNNMSHSFPVDIGHPNKKENIYSTGAFNLDCVNCYVQGSFDVAGHLSVKDWHLEDFTLDTTPRDFKAQIGFEATISASSQKVPEALGAEKELFRYQLPNAGFNINKVFAFTGLLTYNIGFNTSIQGKAKFDFGLNSTLSGSAKAVLDTVNANKSSADGFEGSFDPYFEINEISAGITLSVYSKPKLSFDAEVTKIGKAGVGIGVKLPELSATLEAKYDADGVCPDDAKHTKTGVDLTLAAAIEVDADIDAAWGANANNKQPKWTKTLWRKPWPLPLKRHCLPISLSGPEKPHTNATVMTSASFTKHTFIPTTASGNSMSVQTKTPPTVSTFTPEFVMSPNVSISALEPTTSASASV